MGKKRENLNLTVCVIAKNEQDKIADCIDSVKIADEVLVVDTGSTDLTRDISERMGARVIKYSKGSYDSWRNKGLVEAYGKWILYIDADERVTPKLEKEILELINSQQSTVNCLYAYAIPRKNIIFGKEFKYGGEYPDYQKRLFCKTRLNKWKGKVHEYPIFDGDLGYLKGHLTHIKHNSISEMITKTNKWSEIEAKLMFEANHPKMTILKFATASFREFWDRFIKNRGYKDGMEGVIYSFYQIFSRFVSYAKLWEMQEKPIKSK